MATISELFQRCHAQFISTVNLDALSDCVGVPLQEWRDELGRFRVWAANIGAHQTHLSSLDYRLRDASHIKIQIVTLLNQIQELLTDLKDVLGEQNDEGSQTDGSECLESPPGREISTPETQEIHQGLVETITQLYQISMIIRKPSQHDRLVGTDKLDSESFRFWARQHASDKYPSADAVAIDRISSAMARQRGVLKYRERHHTKLSQGIDSENDGKSTILSETVVTCVFEETPAQLSDMITEAGMSETSYGGTLLEGSGVNAPKIPPLPKKGADNQPFECPYCFYIITARDKRSWARHIFHDIIPYVCIFPGCSTPNKLYESRREWYHHIKQAHDSKLGINDTYDCSICRQCTLSTASFQRHVGQHLEELALFVLPRTESESDMDENARKDGQKQSGSVFSYQINDLSSNDYPTELLLKDGDNLFKCPRLSCRYFTSGFPTAKERDKHINQHERPFRCNYKDCVIGFEIGFVNQTQYKRHMKNMHPSPSTQVNQFPTDQEIHQSKQNILKLGARSQPVPSSSNYPQPNQNQNSPAPVPAGVSPSPQNMKSAAATFDFVRSDSRRHSISGLANLEDIYLPVPVSRHDIEMMDLDYMPRSLTRKQSDDSNIDINLVRDGMWRTENHMKDFLDRLAKNMEEKLAEDEVEVMEELEEEMKEIEKIFELEKSRGVVPQQEEAKRYNINEIEEEEKQKALEEDAIFDFGKIGYKKL